MENITWMTNHSGKSDFILVGIFSQSVHPILLCMVIFIVFLLALIGNIVLIFLIHSDTHLHTPMYFFISQLSLLDVMYISVTVPKMLIDQIMGMNKISVPECAMQMFLYVTLAGSEFFFLGAMERPPLFQRFLFSGAGEEILMRNSELWRRCRLL